MSTTIDTFIYLKRDIEQSFQRVQIISNSSHYDQQELDQLLNHISCTLDDLHKVNQLLRSSSVTLENQSVNIPVKSNALLSNLSETENDFDEENTKFIPSKRQPEISIKDLAPKRLTVGYSKQYEEPLLSSNSDTINTTSMSIPSFDEREDFIRRMKNEFALCKNKIQSTRKETRMELVRLDQAPEDENVSEDHIIRMQDEQLEDMHHSIVSLKNLTQNINFEINDHIRVLDNLETDMINNQNGVENLTNRTKQFIHTSAGGVGGHTCLFTVAVGLFFLIIILILFF